MSGEKLEREISEMKILESKHAENERITNSLQKDTPLLKMATQTKKVRELIENNDRLLKLSERLKKM